MENFRGLPQGNNMKSNQTSWPELNYASFQSTRYLLHMIVQAIGKFKLHNPFEPHWANVALWLNARGLTTGLIKAPQGSFCIDLDMLQHKITITTTWGLMSEFKLAPMSVAQFTQLFFSHLRECKVDLEINLMPQEIANPIPFNQDTMPREYDKALATRWWQILLSSYWVMKRYHSRFDGETPPIGLMWGTFDIRDARYNGTPIQVTGMNASYIRRNAMNEAQVEVGWWPGNEAYPKPAYYAFTYPQPAGIELAKIKPANAKWNPSLMEFVLDYDAVRQSDQPEKDLLDFFESCYQAGSQLAGWPNNLISSGEPEKV